MHMYIYHDKNCIAYEPICLHRYRAIANPLRDLTSARDAGSTCLAIISGGIIFNVPRSILEMHWANCNAVQFAIHIELPNLFIPVIVHANIGTLRLLHK